MKLIIDAPYLAHRSYTAPYNLSTTEGKDSTMVYTFMKSLTKMINERHPSVTCVAWESHGTLSWRRQILPIYKPEKPTLEGYVEQLKDIQKILYNLNIKQYWSPTNEADDVLEMLIDQRQSNLIFTIDKDIFQLVNDSIPVKILCKGKVYDEKMTFERFGVKPHQIPTYLALVGDKSDNIPGIKGIGEVKARELINSNTVRPSVIGPEKYKLMRKYRIVATINYHRDKPRELIPKKKMTTKQILDKYELKKLDLSMYKSRELF